MRINSGVLIILGVLTMDGLLSIATAGHAVINFAVNVSESSFRCAATKTVTGAADPATSSGIVPAPAVNTSSPSTSRAFTPTGSRCGLFRAS